MITDRQADKEFRLKRRGHYHNSLKEEDTITCKKKNNKKNIKKKHALANMVTIPLQY